MPLGRGQLASLAEAVMVHILEGSCIGHIGQDGIDAATRAKSSQTVVDPDMDILGWKRRPAMEASACGFRRQPASVARGTISDRFGLDLVHEIHHKSTISPVVAFTTATTRPSLYITVSADVPGFGSVAKA